MQVLRKLNHQIVFFTQFQPLGASKMLNLHLNATPIGVGPRNWLNCIFEGSDRAISSFGPD